MIAENNNRDDLSRINSYSNRLDNMLFNNSMQNNMPTQAQAQSNINSIGSLFGVTADELKNRNISSSSSSYDQIVQQMSNQINQPGMQQYLPSTLPTNTVSQVPVPIQNQGTPILSNHQQMMPQQAYADPLNRYLTATSQNPMQQQLDPNMLALMMQQQTAQSTGQMYPQTTQTGGSNQPFFFQ